MSLGLTLASAALFGAGAPMMKLNNGVMMPQVALGVWQYDNATAEQAIMLAFKAGFTNIDTAEMYQNQFGTGKAVAKLISGGTKRSDIFITTKTLPCKLDTPAECYAQTMVDVEGDLASLNVDYVDLILLHAPSTGVHTGPCTETSCGINSAQWLAYQSIYKQGKAKAIGVSNYCKSCLECLLSDPAVTVVPAVNQIQNHVGMAGTDSTLIAYTDSKGIITQAYSPLGNGKLPGDTKLAAIGKSHGKSGAQVALKWIVQQGQSVSTKANNSDYLVEDIDLFSWNLTTAEMAALSSNSDYPGSPCWACSE